MRPFTLAIATLAVAATVATAGASAIVTPAVAATAKPSTCELSENQFQGPLAADFNSDCSSDEVIGLPGHDKGAGAIEVRFGYSAKHITLLQQGRNGIPGPRRAGAHFGAVIAVGPLNKDKYDDLAVGLPDLPVDGKKQAGGVQIVFGGAKGFTAGPLITRASLGTTPGPRTDEHFGAAVQISTPDGFPSDPTKTMLRVGVPGATVIDPPTASLSQAGEVMTLEYTTTARSTLSAPAVTTYFEGNGINGAPTAGAHLGAVLGFVNGDYATGAPDAMVDGKTGAGLWAAYPDGPLDDGENYMGEGGTQAGEHLGASFAVGNDTGSDPFFQTSLVGAPGMTVAGHAGAGAVFEYVDDVEEPPAKDGETVITQDTAGVPGSAAAGARFGASLAADLDNGTGYAVIGVPGARVAGHAGAGAVIGFTLDDSNYTLISQATAHVAGVAEAGDHFGAAVAIGRPILHSSAGPVKLLVGVPGEDLDHAASGGLVEVFPFSPDRPRLAKSHLAQRPHPAKNDQYGAAFPSLGNFY